MKTAEAKTTHSNPSQQSKGSQPFFNKGGEGSFFSKETPQQDFFFSPSTIQAKLTIGAPNDPYEQEADAMAEKVVQRLAIGDSGLGIGDSGVGGPAVQRQCAACEEEEKVQKKEGEEKEEVMPKLQRKEDEEEKEVMPKLQRKAIFESNEEQPPVGAVQRKAEGGASEASPDLENRLGASRGGGQSLPEGTRSSMESAFGTDFSSVRVHTGGEAVQMNKELGAQAFTHGSDVYFGAGKYDTGSTEGQRLLGHELTHVVQQNLIDVSPKIQKQEIVKTGDSSELEAFKKQKEYIEDNYQPSTGLGLFNVNVNPNASSNSGLMKISLNINYTFIDGDAALFVGLADQSKNWTDEEKAKWKSDIKSKIEKAWSGHFEFSNPKLFFNLAPQDIPVAEEDSISGVRPVQYPYKMKVAININEVEKDWHYQFRAKKIPSGGFRQSAVGTVGGGKELNKNYYEMDSEDLTPIDKNAPGGGKQTGAIHEFGHMLGLDDEYANGDGKVDHAGLVKSDLKIDVVEGKTDSIMSSGDKFEKQHYITFLEALRKVTKQNDWQYE